MKQIKQILDGYYKSKRKPKWVLAELYEKHKVNFKS